MTALQLYKFIRDNDIEANWVDDDVIMFVNFYLLDEFCKLLGPGIFEDNGIDCHLKQTCLCFWMKDICERFEIDISEIFEGK